MGEWEKVRLGDYLIEHTEKTTRNNQYLVLTSSRVGLFLQTDYYNRVVASKDNTGYNVVPYGYFTYRHMSDDEVFKFNINTILEKGIVSTLYPVFTTRGINDIFLKYLLNEGAEFKKYAFFHKQGGSRTYIYFSMLQELKLTMPDHEEQDRIAEVLIAADEAIATSRALVEKYAAIKQGLMQDLLKKGVPTKLVRVGNIIISGVDKHIRQDEIPIRLCNYTDVYNNRYITDDMIFSKGSVTRAELKRFTLRDGDVIFTKDSENPNDIGIPTVVCGNPNNLVCGYHLAILRPFKEYDGRFIMFALQTQSCVNYFGAMANGITRYGMTIGTLENQTIIAPETIEEQRHIAAILTAADECLTAERYRLAKLEKIKRGLIDDLLTNRVSTDRLERGREYA